MNVKIEESWNRALSEEFDKDYFIKLTDFVRGEYLSGKTIYPEPTVDALNDYSKEIGSFKEILFSFIYNNIISEK
mgnify:CR=1 FL=1